jgi:hypothetical protein
LLDESDRGDAQPALEFGIFFRAWKPQYLARVNHNLGSGFDRR